jgi:hypothetical protein
MNANTFYSSNEISWGSFVLIIAFSNVLITFCDLQGWRVQKPATHWFALFTEVELIMQGVPILSQNLAFAFFSNCEKVGFDSTIPYALGPCDKCQGTT